MLGPEHIRSLLRDALRNRHLGDADIYLTATTQALTRFANNRIHQNVYHDDAVAHVRVAHQKRQGRAVTNNLSPDGMRSAVLQAREHAGLMPEDPDFPGLPNAPRAMSVDAYDEATASAGPEHRAAVVGMVCHKAADAGLEAAGFYRTRRNRAGSIQHPWPLVTPTTLALSAGLLITARSDDSAGWAKGGGWRITRNRGRGACR